MLLQTWVAATDAEDLGSPAAGVKRFIPSEFGINTRQLQGLKIGQIVAGKTKLVDDLQKKAEQNPGFSWTGISNGLFFDLVRDRP